MEFFVLVLMILYCLYQLKVSHDIILKQSIDIEKYQTEINELACEISEQESDIKKYQMEIIQFALKEEEIASEKKSD